MGTPLLLSVCFYVSLSCRKKQAIAAPVDKQQKRKKLAKDEEEEDDIDEEEDDSDEEEEDDDEEDEDDKDSSDEENAPDSGFTDENQSWLQLAKSKGKVKVQALSDLMGESDGDEGVSSICSRWLKL